MTNRGDNGVDVVQRDQQSLQDVVPVKSLVQLIACSAGEHLLTVVDVVQQGPFQ